MINTDEHGLLDRPGDVCLPAYYGETVHTVGMSCGLAMLVGMGRGSEVLFEPIPKGPSQFCDIILLTLCLDAFVPVDYPTRDTTWGHTLIPSHW